jgi:hypothetical protein
VVRAAGIGGVALDEALVAGSVLYGIDAAIVPPGRSS